MNVNNNSIPYILPEPRSSENPSGKVVRVYADIVGDLFHLGHINMLKQAKAYGDELIVGVCSDEDVHSYKRWPILTLEERVGAIRECRLVNEVIPACPLKTDKAFLEKHKIDIVIHGDDMSDDQLRYWYSVPIEMGIFRKVKYTSGISTTNIIRRVDAYVSESKTQRIYQEARDLLEFGGCS